MYKEEIITKEQLPVGDIAGIYCIKVDGCIVYVGQSFNVFNRVHSHGGCIVGKNKDNKYYLLRTAFRQHYTITFHLLESFLYNPKAGRKKNKLNERELFWIKTLKPCLNSVGNKNNGKTINAQEFFDIVNNNKTWVEGEKKIITSALNKETNQFSFR